MLKDKVIVVMGGAGLLGNNFCQAIAEQEGIAIVADINREAADHLANKIIDAGGRAEAFTVNITDEDSLNVLIETLVKHYRHIDGVVNNAYPRSDNWGKKVEEVTYTDFCQNITLHLGGYFLVLQKFCLHFSKSGGGNVINIASVYGSIAPKFGIYKGTSMTMPVEYAAIKAGILHLTKYFSAYFKKSGIRVNSLSPGGILNNQPEIFIESYKLNCGAKGMLNPNDINGALIFLLSDAAKYINGQNIVVDDGFSI